MAKGKYEYWLTEEGLLLLEGWARDGLTDEQIAHNIGISISTLNNWKNKYVEILESLKKGKEVVDYQVENALLNKALNGDTTAQIFWLKNRRPDKWRDKPEPKATDTCDNNLLEQMASSTKALEDSEYELREIQPETANQHELVADEKATGS